MKNIRSVLAMLLCVAMLLSFAACGNKGKEEEVAGEGETTTVQSADGKTQTLDEVGISLGKLKNANKVEALLEIYETVTVENKSSDSSESVIQFFMYDGEPAYVEWIRAANGEESVSGWIKGFDFLVGKNVTEAHRNIEIIDSAKFEASDAVNDYFIGKELVVVAVSVSDEDYKLRSLNEDEKQKATRLFCFDKETLALKKITFENAVGNTETTTVTYNAELNSHSKKIKDAFDGELKTVTVKGQYSDGEKVIDIDEKLELPADWEYVPTTVYDRIDYSLSEDFSSDYEYPGNGEDYILYVTNLFDDDVSGKK